MEEFGREGIPRVILPAFKLVTLHWGYASLLCNDENRGMVNKRGSNHAQFKKRKIHLVLCGGDPCCDRLDLGFDDLNPAGRVNGLDGLEEIPGDLT